MTISPSTSSSKCAGSLSAGCCGPMGTTNVPGFSCEATGRGGADGAAISSRIAAGVFFFRIG